MCRCVLIALTCWSGCFRLTEPARPPWVTTNTGIRAPTIVTKVPARAPTSTCQSHQARQTASRRARRNWQAGRVRAMDNRAPAASPAAKRPARPANEVANRISVASPATPVTRQVGAVRTRAPTKIASAFPPGLTRSTPSGAHANADRGCYGLLAATHPGHGHEAPRGRPPGPRPAVVVLRRATSTVAHALDRLRCAAGFHPGFDPLADIAVDVFPVIERALQHGAAHAG